MAPVLNILTAALSFSLLVARTSVAAPVARQALTVRQLAGEGAACNSVLSSTDSGVGYGVEDAEDNTAGTISGATGAVHTRQLAGEGAACDSVLSSTDSGVGYGVEDAEDNTTNTISGAKGTAPATGNPTGPAPPPPAAPPARRQLDKISNGAGKVIDSTGVPAAGGVVSGTGDSVDGTLTSGAANAGAMVGSTEEGTLEGVGSAVPKL